MLTSNPPHKTYRVSTFAGTYAAAHPGRVWCRECAFSWGKPPRASVARASLAATSLAHFSKCSLSESPALQTTRPPRFRAVPSVPVTFFVFFYGCFSVELSTRWPLLAAGAQSTTPMVSPDRRMSPHYGGDNGRSFRGAIRSLYTMYSATPRHASAASSTMPTPAISSATCSLSPETRPRRTTRRATSGCRRASLATRQTASPRRRCFRWTPTSSRSRPPTAQSPTPA